jgi:hypothetical protein
VSPDEGAAHNRSQRHVGGLGNAFVLPAPNTFGNFGYNNLYGPGLFNQDIALDKSFQLRENYRFTLRAEAFNSFNHTNSAFRMRTSQTLPQGALLHLRLDPQCDASSSH